VPDWPRVVAEAARLLRPGGLLVLDTLNATALSRLVAVRLAERLPGAPRRVHDPPLVVDARALVRQRGPHGIRLRFPGLRPAARTPGRPRTTRGGGPCNGRRGGSGAADSAGVERGTDDDGRAGGGAPDGAATGGPGGRPRPGRHLPGRGLRRPAGRRALRPDG